MICHPTLKGSIFKRISETRKKIKLPFFPFTISLDFSVYAEQNKPSQLLKDPGAPGPQKDKTGNGEQFVNMLIVCKIYIIFPCF
jgi:hypothetical protein